MSAHRTQSEARAVACYRTAEILASLMHVIPALAMVYCSLKGTLLLPINLRLPV